MPSLKPCVLLDLDGTLIDSQPGISSSCAAALCALGHGPEPSFDLSGMIGPPIEDIMQALLEPYGDDRVVEAVAAYRADYGENGLFRSLAYPGIHGALEELQRADARIYLATSKRRKFATRILKHLNLASFFDGVYGSEEDGAFDHKPELVSYIMERHALAPDNCVMVGDRRHDIIGAHANDISALGVLWGYGTRAELEAAGADGLIEDPPDLPAAALAMVTPDSR